MYIYRNAVELAKQQKRIYVYGKDLDGGEIRSRALRLIGDHKSYAAQRVWVRSRT